MPVFGRNAPMPTRLIICTPPTLAFKPFDTIGNVYRVRPVAGWPRARQAPSMCVEALFCHLSNIARDRRRSQYEMRAMKHSRLRNELRPAIPMQASLDL